MQFAPLCIWLQCVMYSSGTNTGAGACLVEPKGNADFAIYKVTHCSQCANGKSTNQLQLVTNVTLMEQNHPKNNTSLSAADSLS